MEKTINYQEILERKLAGMFPDSAQRELVRAELLRYGQEKYEREPERVRLALLKVAGASLEKIREWIDIAKRDYRDVLAAAEYPNELTSPTWSLPAAECDNLIRNDREQYLAWIRESG